MRSLTTIEGQARAEAFVAYLLTQNISTHVEPTDASKTHWEVWIRDEDRLVQAQEEWRRFESNPENPVYQQAVREARSILKEKRDEAVARQRNIRTNRDVVQNSMFNGRLPPLTLTLIILCCVFSILSSFSSPKPSNRLGTSIVKQLKFVDMAKFEKTQDPAASLKAFELWRIFTPMFLHGDPFHLIMNMLALASLGRLTERLERTPRYLWLILACAIGSHCLKACCRRTSSESAGYPGPPTLWGYPVSCSDSLVTSRPKPTCDGTWDSPSRPNRISWWGSSSSWASQGISLATSATSAWRTLPTWGGCSRESYWDGS
jgi:hypothetical protein